VVVTKVIKQKVRDAPLLQVLPDRAVGDVAQTGHHGEDAALLHQLAHHLDRIRRVEVVIAHQVGDLAAVDAPLRVDVLEVGPYPVGDGRLGRRRRLA
jgi:hypothetical protein